MLTSDVSETLARQAEKNRIEAASRDGDVRKETDGDNDELVLLSDDE